MIDVNLCRTLELPATATVACQGAEGAYSQIAADVLFEDCDILYMRTFEGVFRAVESGLCTYGILPIENSNAGSVTDVYDLMKKHRFYVARSLKMTISHALLAKERIALNSVRKIYTHEQTVRQCGDFFEEHPDIEICVCANNAKAAQLVAESDETDIAALASQNCGELYGLKTLKINVQNNKNNFTRFICISKDCQIIDGADRISLMLTLEHRAGALHEVIKQFAEAGFNLLKLESRPIADTDFEFMFYFDVQASLEDEGAHILLDKLENDVQSLTFLGNYTEITQSQIV